MAKITYIREGEGEQTIDVDLNEAPFDDHGKPRSFLGPALTNDVFLDHSCGGVCACSTCHIIVEQGADKLSESSDAEEDMLDMAPGLTLRSRLGCQAEMLDNEAHYIVRIPKTNRNQVSEHG